MPHRTSSVFDGNIFVISDARGDISPAAGVPIGFFWDDTRLVSHWRLTLAGEGLDMLSVGDLDYFAVEFFLVPRAASIYQNPYLSLIRRRLVRGTWLEEILLVNHRDETIELNLALEADTDFADLFEVKDHTIAPRQIIREAFGSELVLSYEREKFLRESRISGDQDCMASAAGLSWMLKLGPHEQRLVTVRVAGRGEERDQRMPVRRPAESFEVTAAEMRAELAAWLADAPRLRTDWDGLGHAYRRSLSDLAALQIYPPHAGGDSLPAAGLPWFMTLFGRDSLITSFQALPMRPRLARTTLSALALRQARDFDDFRDQEPGKILHEIRFGELTVFGDRPHSPYFGSADATPLFLVLLDEYERWTGDTELVRRLEPNARAALDWIDRHGDRDGDGYVEYQRRNDKTGLLNQCWKDSWNAILFADGRRAEPPIATCEIQGYVYDAKRRCARLAAQIWGDDELARRLDAEAADLRTRFHEDFWLPERGYYALALDKDKRRVDSLTSNIGHLLWSGIVEPEPAASLAAHLMGERLFSGWGVRTMAVSEGGYNPIEYHNGTVWPHDNSLIAEGLRRYGFREEAARIAVALVDASTRFAGCLPEVFAGYPRDLTQYAVEYPTASRPQAWAAGAPLLFVRSLLGLDPDGDELRSDPWLPEEASMLELHGVSGRWGRANVEPGEPAPAA